MWFDSSRPNARAVLVFATGLAVATGLTFWLGLRATREWQHSTREAAETRANEVAALLTVALERDMKGGQVSVLVPFNEALVNSPPYELADRFARGFARFPYLESFYVWSERGGQAGATYVFNRADRRPRWDSEPPPEDPFPVVFRRDPVVLRELVSHAREQATLGLRFALEEVDVGGVRYQSVSQLMYEGEGSQARLSAVVGFLVDLDWVRQHYFGEFIRQIQGIIGDPTLSIEIRTAEGGRLRPSARRRPEVRSTRARSPLPLPTRRCSRNCHARSGRSRGRRASVWATRPASSRPRRGPRARSCCLASAPSPPSSVWASPCVPPAPPPTWRPCRRSSCRPSATR